MQYQEPDCSRAATMLEADLACLWPSSTPEDVIRRKLACILADDPAHRLRVAHLEPLLQLALGPQQLPCSSGRLQALLTDPSTAKIFPVDFSAQVPDWRSRVVFLDLSTLSQHISAAKLHHHQQQQQQADAASAADQDAGTRMQRGSSSGCSESAALAGHMLAPDGATSAPDASAAPTQQPQRGPSATAIGNARPPAPLALDTIFGTSPAFGGQQHLPAGRGGGSSNGGGRPAPLQAHNSHSAAAGMEGGAGGAASGGQQPSPSLFGSSFEVPHAIASCWADHQGSFGSAGGAKHHHQVLDALAGAEGCGSSSMASGSSARSFTGPPAAGAAGSAGMLPARPPTGSSRLRNASTCPTEGGEAGQQQEPAAANSIDVCTPRSGLVAGPGADRSPLLSGDCEEDAEYSEAALVFGSGNPTGAAAEGGRGDLTPGKDGQAGHGGALQEEGSAVGLGLAAGAQGTADRDGVSGQLEGEESFCMQGVDWSCLAGLQQQQHQQSEAAYAYQQQQAQQQQQQQALLFGLDDFGGDGLTPRSSSGGGAGAAATAHARSNALSAAATGALTARRLLMEHAGLREDCSTGGFGSNPGLQLGSSHHSPHHMAALAGSLGHLGTGSAPATLSQQQQHEQLLLAAAAAAGSGGGFGGYGSLLDPDMMSAYGMPCSHQHMAALASSLQGGSYGSGGLLGSDRSLGSGFWASPGAAAAMQQLLLQQQRQQAVAAAAVVAAAAQSQHQQVLGGDGSMDTSFRSDQMGKGEQHPVGSAGGSASAPGKGAAFGRLSHQGQQEEQAGERRSNSGAAGAGLTPRLTGWASIAAKEPPPGSVGPQPPQQAASSSAGSVQNGMRQQPAGGKGVGDGGQGKAVAKLPARVKAEVQNLVTQFQGVLKLEDFDDGVVHQLNAKRSEDEAVAAVRHIAHYDLGTIQHMAAYLNHLVKHYNHNAAAAAAAAAAADSSVGLSNALAVAAAAVAANTAAAAAHGGGGPAAAAAMQQLLGAGMLGGNGTLGSTVGAGRGAAGGAGGVGAAAGLGAYGGQIRLASVPVSTKAMLQKLPLKVFKQIELLVQNCAYLEWRHFDAGVIKVLSQLSKLCEGDVFEELELLAATDLSNVEYMPAYLNKRLNNKLWSRRKAEGHVPS